MIIFMAIHPFRRIIIIIIRLILMVIMEGRDIFITVIHNPGITIIMCLFLISIIPARWNGAM